MDNGEVGVWVWCGRHASKREKQESVNNAAVCKHDIIYSAIVTYSSLVEELKHRYLQLSSGRVSTSLENLEYSEISLNMENSGNYQGIACNHGE